MTVPPRLLIEYVVPLRCSSDTHLPEFTRYLRSLRGWVDITVVDGSGSALFAAHAALAGPARHVARTLVNRAFGSDYPGTVGVRRSFFRRVGGYDGDVLFENLQLIRTITATGGRVIRADDLFITRRPPTRARFAEQRVRQAYDDFAQPARLLWEASWLPSLTVTAARRPAALPLLLLLPMLLAELGRRRHRGRETFPPSSALWAPLWTLERAITVWIAVGQRATGGARYRGQRIRLAATSPCRLLHGNRCRRVPC